MPYKSLTDTLGFLNCPFALLLLWTDALLDIFLFYNPFQLYA